MRSRGGDQDSIVVKVGGKCKPQNKVGRDLQRKGVLFELGLLIQLTKGT